MKSKASSKVTKVVAKVRQRQYKILLLVKKGAYTTQIARQLNIPRTTVQSQIKRLLANGLIETEFVSTFKSYKLTAKGYRALKCYGDEISRYLRQSNRRLHRLDVNFKILRDNPNAKFDKINRRFNNWIPEYTKVTFPIGMTFLRTPNTIVVKFHEFETSKRMCLTDFFSHILRGCFYAHHFLRTRYKIEVDIPDRITDQHIVNERPDLKGKVDEKKTTTLCLNRKSKSIVDTDIEAKAWLDHSKGLPEIETNDFLYEERLLKMPETVERMGIEFNESIKDLTQQIKLHLKATEEWRKSAIEIRDALKCQSEKRS